MTVERVVSGSDLLSTNPSALCVSIPDEVGDHALVEDLVAVALLDRLAEVVTMPSAAGLG